LLTVNNNQQSGIVFDKAIIGGRFIELISDIERRGIHLEYLTDFEQFREVALAISDKADPTPIFDVKSSDICSENGFWIKGTSETGEIVHLQAVRFDNLTGTTLADHWQENPDLYLLPGVDIDTQQTQFESAPASLEITGTVCYHGELWLEKSSRLFGLAPKLGQISMLMSLMRFAPDYLYCLMIPKHIKRGLSVQYGFLHLHPYGIRWHIRGQDESFDEYLVWITGKELADITAPPKGEC